jgi:hypothetical protein
MQLVEFHSTHGKFHIFDSSKRRTFCGREVVIGKSSKHPGCRNANLVQPSSKIHPDDLCDSCFSAITSIKGVDI